MKNPHIITVRDLETWTEMQWYQIIDAARMSHAWRGQAASRRAKFVEGNVSREDVQQVHDLENAAQVDEAFVVSMADSTLETLLDEHVKRSLG